MLANIYAIQNTMERLMIRQQSSEITSLESMTDGKTDFFSI